MIEVNTRLISGLLEPFAGLGDDDSAVEKYRSLDANDELVMKKLIEGTIAKHFRGYSQKGRDRIKLTLRYGLSKPDFDFAQVMDADLVPFYPPETPRDLFMWIWDVLFEGEEFIPLDLTKVRVRDDIYELNRASMYEGPNRN